MKYFKFQSKYFSEGVLIFLLKSTYVLQFTYKKSTKNQKYLMHTF